MHSKRYHSGLHHSGLGFVRPVYVLESLNPVHGFDLSCTTSWAIYNMESGRRTVYSAPFHSTLGVKSYIQAYYLICSLVPGRNRLWLQ